MLQIRNLSYSIGELSLLKDINWTLNPGKRLGLIGPNGAGKTTLLRILAGEIKTSGESIIKPKNYSIGYLPQEEIALERGSVLSLVLEGHQEVIDIEAEMDDIHQKLESSQNNLDVLLQRLGFLEAHFSTLGGYELEAQAKQILAGLGFNNSDFHRPLNELSGGWRMRAYLARLLLQKPDLLLLDEPTNHLDLESLEWVESYLNNFSGGMVLVSHDRFFLDKLAHEIGELYRGKLTHYAGNYRFFEKKKKEIQEQIIKKWQEQKEERERLQRFIDRFRYKNTKASQVQSRIKQLEKLEIIELPEDQKTIRFQIKADTKSYKEVIRIKNLYFRYEKEWVLRDINLDIYRGDKIALVGANGAGKTTLTRLLSKELTPEKGTLNIGERVHFEYYAQHQIDSLNMNNSIFEEVGQTAAASFQPKLREILGVFHFSGDDIQKRIGILSGGEKARVSLAKILLSPSNFLVMDEATNHLDLRSKEALEQALADYDGTLLLISHDRYFLDKLVSRVLELKDGKITEYVGNYSDYLEKSRNAELDSRENISPLVHQKTDAGGYYKSKEQKQKEAQARQSVSKERNRLQKEIATLESNIEKLEARKIEIENDLADPGTYKKTQKAVNLKKDYDDIVDEINKLESRWENCHIQFEDLITGL